ncbi:MAG: RNA 2',3'-cyclic phosphodiesterase [Chthoniobacterales bacterium]
MKRLFVAIDLPSSTRQLFATLNPKLRGVRLTEPEQVHLTIGFFGNVTPQAEEELRDRLSAIEWKPFFLPVIGVGAFPSKGRPNVLWVGVGAGHPHLFQLHKRVQEAALGAGIEPDLRSFHPHITIARCRDVSADAIKPFLRKHADFDAGMIHVDECHLYSSKLTPAGSIHTRELTLLAS